MEADTVAVTGVNAGSMISSSTAGNNRTVLQVLDSEIIMGYYNGSSYSSKSGAIDTNPHIISVTHAASSAPTLWLDGTELTGTNNPGTSDGSTVKIARDCTNANRYYDGSIAEILIYDRVLSASEVSLVNTYLSNKWSISI